MSRARTTTKRAPAKRPSSKRAPARRKKKVSRWRRLRRLALLTAGLSVLGFLAFVGLMYAFADIPEPADVARVQSITVLDREGRRLGRIASEADRVSIDLDEMPRHLRDAVIAIEDRTFYRHPGVSVGGTLRAAFRNVVGREVKQGGSTITQQYVKNAFTGADRTMIRKVKEAVLALKLERQRSKDEILELYLNTIYLGRGAYGVEAAARTYFGSRASRLDLHESALLAAMIHAPENYDPAEDPGGVRPRRDTVLRLMAEQGLIEQARAERAMRRPVEVRKRRPGGLAPHALDDIRRELEKRIGPTTLYAGGVTVRSTIDRDMQRAAEAAVRAVYPRAKHPDVALVAIDPATGAVRAMVGARSFASRQLNLASRGRRQPGSTFKPFTLAAALDDGMGLDDVFAAPASITIDTPTGPWRVENYDQTGHGRITVRRATELSVNTVYAQMIDRVGPEAVADIAARAGIGSALDPVHSLALGTYEVTPLELASAYATFAARGTAREPTLIDHATGRNDRLLFEFGTRERDGMERDVADRVNEALQSVVTQGTGGRARIGRPAAGKTGTTQRNADAWFAGYTPDLVTVVWNGFPEGRASLRSVVSPAACVGRFGGSCPAEIWRRFMTAALADVPARPFATVGSDDEPVGEPEPTATPDESLPPEPTEIPEPEPEPSESPEPSPSPTPKRSPKPSPSPTPSPTPSPSPTATPAPDRGG